MTKRNESRDNRTRDFIWNPPVEHYERVDEKCQVSEACVGADALVRPAERSSAVWSRQTATSQPAPVYRLRRALLARPDEGVRAYVGIAFVINIFHRLVHLRRQRFHLAQRISGSRNRRAHAHFQRARLD